MEQVVKKMKFKTVGIVINAPAAIEEQFIKLGFKINFEQNLTYDNALIFINNRLELLTFLETKLSFIEPDGVLWFAYAKGTSKIRTDINRDSIREAAEAFGIKTVTAISIDETWSALRFRPIDRVGK